MTIFFYIFKIITSSHRGLTKYDKLTIKCSGDRSTLVQWLTHSAEDRKILGSNPSQESAIHLNALRVGFQVATADEKYRLQMVTVVYLSISFLCKVAAD